MRYNLDENNQLDPVIIVDLPNGDKLVHPSDDVVDELKVGYRLVNTRPPEYDPDTQTASFTYGISRGKIVRVWEVADLPETTEG